MGPEPPLDDSFYLKILDLENHLSDLQQTAPGDRPHLLDVALEELKNSLEEMHVAHEELQSQNAELQAARYSLEEEQQRYQELFDLAPDGYLVTTTEGVIQEANQTLCHLLGRSSEFVSGKPLLVFVAPENRRDFNLQLHRLDRHQGAAEFESRLQTREGHAFFARFAVNPARDSQGQRIGLRWLVHDSTQRNRLEAWRTRQRVAELSRISQSITTTLDLPTVLQEIVSGACRLIGVRHGAMGVFNSSGEIDQLVTHGLSQEERHPTGNRSIHKPLLEWLHQHQQPIRLADLSQHPQSAGIPPHHPAMKAFLGVPVPFDHRVLANLYLAEIEDGPEFNQDDEDLLVLFAAQAALTINNALTYQREIAGRAQLESERRRLAALMDTSPVGIMACDINGRIALVNREAERMLGIAHRSDISLDKYQQAAVYRRRDESTYPLQDLPLRRALDHGETVLGKEVRFEFTDGRAVLMAVSARPLYGPDGKQTGAITVFQDISVLEETERLRSEFLGMVSHELRAPITAIKGATASMLGSLNTPDPQEGLEFVQIINEQADQLSSLVSNLLDLTRIESGTLLVNPEPASLREIVDDAVAAFGRFGNTHGVQIDTLDSWPVVLADRPRIGQVLANLLSNAAKFSPASTPIVLRIEPGLTHLSVTVQDSGRGFPSDRSSQLFQKFSQIFEDGDRSRGTGLGLAICKGIVEAHGGRIWAGSPGPGRGSTFTFMLPLASQSPDALGGGTDRKPAPPGPARHPGQRTRILAVDDDPHVLRHLRRLLEEAGFAINGVDDPEEVIRLVELEKPELILLDLNLSNASGLELLRQIRELSNVPVIFLTGLDDNQTVVSALRAGADDYITKPFSPSELLARIDTVLHRRADYREGDAVPNLVLEDLRIDFTRRKVSVSGREVTLTATEYNLLHCLASNAGRVLTHDQLLHRVWGEEYSGETEIIRSMIRNLRAKLGDNARSPRMILTHTGVGYSMPSP